MEYIRITKENIDKEHICCAMSGKQSLAKKEWLKQRFEEGLVFYRSAERGKCFIEYIPAENAWVPIEAAGWLYINCLWVSGSLKGHGYSSELLEECLRDAKAQGKNGVCILCATPIIGCQRCRRLQGNTGFRSKPSTSPRKRRHRMCPHPSQHTRCSGMGSL